MNAIKDTWRELLRRRLWPVALLLVGALVAVPMVLAKTPDPAATTPVHNAKGEDDIASTYVSLADSAGTTEETKRRRVLGLSKDPFEPKALPKVKKAKKAKKAKAAATATPEPTTVQDSGSSGGSGGATTPPPSTAPAPEPTETVPAYSIKVRFGTTENSELPTKTIERLSVLPDEENPVIVYRGVEDGGDVAVFELTGEVDAQGDGTCAPTPEDCQYVKLRAGETEFITVTDTGTEADAQYQLDLVKIYKKQTKVKATDDTTGAQSLAKAGSSSLKGSSVKLRRRNRYVFDPKSGLLHRAKNGTKTPLSSL
jgi:hypothetical protein